MKRYKLRLFQKRMTRREFLTAVWNPFRVLWAILHSRPVVRIANGFASLRDFLWVYRPSSKGPIMLLARIGAGFGAAAFSFAVLLSVYSASIGYPRVFDTVRVGDQFVLKLDTPGGTRLVEAEPYLYWLHTAQGWLFGAFVITLGTALLGHCVAAFLSWRRDLSGR